MPTTRQRDPRVFITLVVLVLILVPFLAAYFPFGPDWRDVYHRAAVDVLHGRNPHDPAQPRFLNPTYILLPMLPLGLLPVKIGGAIFLIASLGSFAYAAYRMGAKPIAMGAFIGSPPVLHCLLNGNIEWIPLLGMTLTPQIGLFFVMAKPQIGVVIALYWLVETWRDDGWRAVVRVFAPVTIAFGVTFLLFGFWFLKWADQPEQWWNASLFPYSVPVGLYLFYQAVRQRELRFAMGAGPCLSPYVLFHSWAVAVLALVHNQRWTLIVTAFLWALLIIRAAFPTLW